jgi:hypothetical protein
MYYMEINKNFVHKVGNQTRFLCTNFIGYAFCIFKTFVSSVLYHHLLIHALQVGRSRVRFPMVSLEFFIDIILSAALWLWG